MQVVISDISGVEINKHMVDTRDSQVIIGGVILHLSQEEQIEILEIIAGLQQERMPEKYEGVFEPYTNARDILDKFYEQKKRADSLPPVPSGEDDLFFDDDDDDE